MWLFSTTRPSNPIWGGYSRGPSPGRESRGRDGSGEGCYSESLCPRLFCLLVFNVNSSVCHLFALFCEFLGSFEDLLDGFLHG